MTDLQLLVIHCEKRHQETLVYPIKCNTCDRPFIFQEALSHHQKTEHGQEIDTFHCDLCSQDFFAKVWTTLSFGHFTQLGTFWASGFT